VRYFRWQWKGMLQEQMGSLKEDRHHPTQKPVPLFKWCLEKYSKPGDLILDPFAGSGTTALAAHALDRRFVCIEREAEYCEVARNRLRDAQMQTDLFLDSAKQDPETAQTSLTLGGA
jgi:site-specific DNA-methyltransferase (adenine-specific)